MKKFKKLIPALCMLLVSAVLVGTSTYAWFSMQDQVTVSGLKVTAQTDQKYLIIGTGDNNSVALLQGLPAKTPAEGDKVDFGMTAENSKVKPVEPKTAVTDAQNIATVGNWQYKYAENANSSTAQAGSEHDLTAFDGYVIVKTVYMTIAKNTPELSDITADVTITASEKATRVILAVTVGTSYKAVQKFDKTETGRSLVTGTVTDETLVKVDIYIYVDGEDATIYTNNAANLGTAEIGIKFNA